jgi:phosphate transport system protein
MAPTPQPTPASPSPTPHVPLTIERRLAALRRRLVREASMAIDMLEEAVEALARHDIDAARAVRRADDRVDLEEVAIEEECYEVMTLFHPFAKDFRVLAFILKVNADIERVADHAASIAKVVTKIHNHYPPGVNPPPLPTAVVELGERVPIICHKLLRAVLDEDAEAARQIVVEDDIIDKLDRRVFDEVQDIMKQGDEHLSTGLLYARVGRELERIGDLMAGIAEDVVYLTTGEIIRHQGKRRLRAGQ